MLRLHHAPQSRSSRIVWLRAGPYLVGDRFSGADLLLASLAHCARPMLPAGEPVDGWLARINARPALARALAKDAG